MKIFKAPCSVPALSCVVGISFFLAWLAAMACITLKSALYYSDYFEEKSTVYAAAMSLRELGDAESSPWPYAVEKCIWDTLAYRSNKAYGISTNGGSLYFSSENIDGWQSAAAVYDGEGKLLEYSSDYIYFSYDTEEYWESATADMPTGVSGYVKVDASLVDFDDWQYFLSLYIRAMRFTGVLDGAEFHASRIEYISYNEFHSALYSLEPDAHYFEDDGTEVTEYHSYSDRDVIEETGVSWHTLYDSGEEAEGAVTIYASHVSVSDYDEGKTLKYKGESFDNLVSVLLSVGTTKNLDTDIGNLLHQRSSFNLIDTIIFEEVAIYDYDNLVEIDIGLTPARKYIVTTAVRCSPLGTAISELKLVYIVSFMVSAGIALWVCLRLRRRLIDPIVSVGAELGQGLSPYSPKSPMPGDWQEVQNLFSASAGAQGRLQSDKFEINRLNTALEYAKTAEENRRQMTSNIAHELKTPLAVIHSYTEGLKEHIAEEKREKYLDVILSETERMDAMVLEMLDLSRLEAGRVKLARDDFSLSELTKSTFERLSMAMEAKNLTIEYDFAENSKVTADEGRIGQVIENFATNAVKYTPFGGSIRVRTEPWVKGIRFSVENDGEPLSDEALGRVWDTFYRADESRSSAGTGLGLSIAKSIVELHGGKCSVRNTETGIEFSFII